ncbi:MAG: hypothetical protein A2033_10460 [Bacteroidetes bacterium GWA2_31_9]|nr:MAG: hypothetical protein A2033_10460 [Bacteroidetes bacterium GWA2_31_9]
MKTTLEIFQSFKKAKTLTYWRNPTKEEIKFGYGAIHYRDFETEECFNEDKTLKLALIAKDDGLKYYSCNFEYFITKSYKINKRSKMHGVFI